MEWSNYNFELEIDNDTVGIFNSFSNSFYTLTKYVHSDIKSKLCSGKLDELPEDLFQLLVDNKNIVESDEDIYNVIKFKSYRSRFSTDVLSLVIAPTIDCNFSCSYCFEHHKSRSYMNFETESNLMQFINSFKTKKVHVIWFGGEPLLNFRSIKNITQHLIENNFDLHASMITNGYLLTKEKVEWLKVLKINSVQITLDGVGEIHNNRRTHKKGKEHNTFERIIENLDYFVPFAEQHSILISIKVTVDKANKNSFLDVSEFIKHKYHEQFVKGVIDVSINFVNDDANGNSINPCVFQNSDKISYYRYLVAAGYDRKRLKYLLEPHLVISECMMRSVNTFGIGPDGDIYKCLEDFGDSSKAIGNINKRFINNALLAKLTLASDVFDNKQCGECSCLPLCGGGCPYKRLNNNSETDGFYCTIYKEYLGELLSMYYAIQ